MVELEQMLEQLTKSQSEIKALLIKAENERIREVNGYISEDDAVKLLGKAKIWFWRKRKEGLIPHKKLGSTVFYLKDDLFNLFDNFE
jgi:predicted DNA-binding transcriptional regulator AlpA